MNKLTYEIRRALELLRCKGFHNYIFSLKVNNKTLWKAVTIITNENIAPLKIDTKYVYSKLEKCKVLTNHFKKIFTKNRGFHIKKTPQTS